MPMNPRLLRPSSGAGAAPAPIPASLLCHFDGDVSDSSPSNLYPAASSGDLAASAKFGSASIGLSADSENYIRWVSNDAFNLTGEVPYTVEFWLWLNSMTGTYQTFVTRRVGSNWQWLFGFSNPNNRMLFFSANAQGEEVPPGYSEAHSAGEIPLQQWIHVAGCVKDGVAKLFVDGKQVDSAPWAVQPDNGADLWVGQQGSYGEWFDGRIDELRIVKGLAVYDGPFTPPTAPPSVNATAAATLARVYGCTDSVALNYNASANVENGSCSYPCPSYGTPLREGCSDCDYGTFYADGNCGEYFDAWNPGGCC